MFLDAWKISTLFIYILWPIAIQCINYVTNCVVIKINYVECFLEQIIYPALYIIINNLLFNSILCLLAKQLQLQSFNTTNGTILYFFVFLSTLARYNAPENNSYKKPANYVL